MFTFTLFAALAACTSDCKEGWGMAADGVCYPIATAGEDTGAGPSTGLGGENGDGGEGGDAGDGGDPGGDPGGAGDGGAGEGGDPGGAGDGGAGAGGDPGGAGEGGGTGDGSGVELSGSLTFFGTIQGTAVCSVSMWAEEAIDTATGFPDRLNHFDLSVRDVPCPTANGVAEPFSAVLELSTAQNVYFFASLDQDGNLLTPTDRTEVGAASNPNTVAPGDVLSDVAFALSPPSR